MRRKLALLWLALGVIAAASPVVAQEGVSQAAEATSTERVNSRPAGPSGWRAPTAI
jgi:hypothetical protein